MAQPSLLSPPPAPALAPASRVSHSLAEAIASCPLQAAFQRDPNYRALERPSPAGALGLVSHELAEQVAGGAFDQLDPDAVLPALERAWRERVQDRYEQLRQAWPLGQVPPPERWPGYVPMRRRLLRRLAEAVRGRAESSPGTGGRVAMEQTLESSDTPLHGRPDRVEIAPDGVQIVDLKTGGIGEDELRPSHRRQLLLYAYLWHSAHGAWPARGVIQRLDGSRLTLEIDPREAAALADQLVQQLADFNAAATAAGSAWQLAAPGPEACQYCSFRGYCPPFFETVGEDWGWYRKSLLGVVTDSSQSGALKRIDIALEAGTFPPDTEAVRVIGMPAQFAPRPGSRVAVVDALPTRVAGEVRIAWDSLLCEWPSTGDFAAAQAQGGGPEPPAGRFGGAALR